MLIFGLLSIFAVVAGDFVAITTAHWLAARALGIRGLSPWGTSVSDAYFAASRMRRFLVRLAGPIAGWLFASALFFGGMMLTGRERLTLQVNVVPGSPASRAGIIDGDTIVSVAGRRIGDWNEATTGIHEHAGEEVELVVDRDGALVSTRPAVARTGTIGVRSVSVAEPAHVGETLIDSIGLPGRVATAVVVGTIRRLSGATSATIAGPIAMARSTGGARERSWGDWVRMMAVLAAFFWPGLVVADGVIAFASARAYTRRRGGPAGPMNFTSGGHP